MKAYLLFLLGTVVLPNVIDEGISAVFLPLLGKTTVNKYTWRAAMLAVLKDSLKTTKNALDKKNTTSLYGFSDALMVRSLFSEIKLITLIHNTYSQLLFYVSLL